MNRKKLKLVVSAMSILLAVQSPGAVLADTGQETAVEAQVSTEETVSEPGTEEILNGMGTEITQESEGYQEEILPGTADEVLPGTGEEESQILRGTADIAETQNPTVQEALDKAEKYLQSAVTSPVVDTIGGEWSVMAMARAGYLSDTAKANYLANLYMKLDDTNGVLHNAKYTEYSRVIMALSSIGTDPSRINGYNLLKPLAKFEKVNQQALTELFCLIAWIRRFEIPEREGEGTRLPGKSDSENPFTGTFRGGWALQESGRSDITVAMQALSPYKERADVGAALNRGLDKLASMQDADGGYGSSYISEGEEPVKNLESTAQVVIALSAIDVSLLEQDKFMKNGKTLLDEILRFQKEDGSFEHIKGGGSDAMATDQGTLALLAWSRAVNGQTSLYDMTDTETPDEGTESEENIEAFRSKLNALPEQITLAEKQRVYNLKVELELLKDFEEKESFRNILQAKGEEIDRQEAEVEALDHRIWNELNPLKITLKEKDTVEELLSIYHTLPENNKSFVTRIDDLRIAESIVDKLERGIIGKEIFEKAQASRMDYIYEGEGYTIRVKGKKIAEPADMNAEVEIQQKEDALQFALKHEGELPGEVEISMPCTFKDGVFMLYNINGNEMQWTGAVDGVLTCDVSAGGIYTLKKGNMGFEDETEALSGTSDVTTDESVLKGTKKSANTAKKSTSAGSAKKSAAKKKTESNTTEAEVKNGVVEKAAFEAVKGKDKNLKIKGETGKDKPYTLTVNGKDIKTVKDMKVGIREGSDYAEDIQKLSENPYIFSFDEKGELPGEMQVELTTGQEDGKYLLMKYKEKERKAEYIQKVTVKDKQTKFLVKTGGEYFIAKKAKTKSLNELEEKEAASAAANTEKTVTAKKSTGADAENSKKTSAEAAEEKSALPAVLTGTVVALAGIAGGIIWYIKRKRQ
ncbi:MAG: cell surface protein [Blautia hansenii]